MFLRRVLANLGWLGLVLTLAAGLSVFVVLNPTVRDHLRHVFSPADREVLSVAQGPVLPEGTARVVKIRTPTHILIEVYGPLGADALTAPLVDSIRIEAPHESLFQFQGRATSLALKDMNGDNIYEIIAPTYKKDLTPQLNIFTFNSTSRKFEAYLE